MTIIIGRNVIGPKPFHAVYQVGKQGIHAFGTQLGRLKVTTVRPDVVINYWETRVVTISAPVLFPARAAATGHNAVTCVTAAANAFVRGWIPFWPL